MHHWILLLALAMGLLLGGCASPPEPARRDLPALCRNIDTNHDGIISKEELLAAAKNKEEAAALYDLCDVGHKGYLTYDELLSQSNRLEQVIRLTPPGR